jgi:hypothetical protein
MTEADLLEQLNSTGAFLWSLMQYWTSISFGILIGAYLAAKRINAYFLGAFILVYAVFTGQITWLMRLQIETIRGIIIDLRVIEDSAAGLSNTAMAVLEQSPAVITCPSDLDSHQAQRLLRGPFAFAHKADEFLIRLRPLVGESGHRLIVKPPQIVQTSPAFSLTIGFQFLPTDGSVSQPSWFEHI